ncbi:MAG: site-specific DNA-methyltransferase [Arthrospira sp. SH-MAG29]|nr:site-specific DNA-methyltransferase [Arthrospira sp. SH-MAG29]MBS0015875.1 site-specific DNA-methyltransferase [Arthrospira sp. SH-MAG29]
MIFDEIVKILGCPYFQAPNCLIYNLDCLEAMAHLPDEWVALTVTSPPYNIGKEYEKKLPLKDYLNWCQKWIKQIHRITLPHGAFWLNLGYLSIPNQAKTIPIPYLLWDKIPFYLIQEIVWNYGAGVAAKHFFSPRNEKFLWYVKNHDIYTFNLDDVRDKNVKYPYQKKNGKLKVNPLGKNPTDVWEIPKVTSGKQRSSKERTPHPAQFPMAVIARIIRASSNPHEIVIDPFMGSGTTAMVALDWQRPVIGFEIREDYCQIAADRIDDFLVQKNLTESQLSLF